MKAKSRILYILKYLWKNTDEEDFVTTNDIEYDKLMQRRNNLIEMRADGDIEKDLFREKKQEIENRLSHLTDDIIALQPKEEESFEENFEGKLLNLRKKLETYTGFEYSVIPESIVEAFVSKVWVSKDEFRWYLRTGNSQEEFSFENRIKIGSFTLSLDDAKKYQYSFSTRKRIYNWVDLNVSVWI